MTGLANADQTVASDAAAVQHRHMADDHAFLDQLRPVRVGVDDAAVLQIGARPEGNPRQVAPHDAAVPDVGTR